MNLFKSNKPKLDYKSKQITIMYLDKAIYKLEKELSSNERTGESEIFTANHDIKCLENAIRFLEKS